MSWSLVSVPDEGGHQRPSETISMQSASSSWSLMGVPAVAAIARRQACTSALPPRVGRRSMIPVFISDRIPLPNQPRSPGPWEIPDDGGHQTSEWMSEVIRGHPVTDDGGHQTSSVTLSVAIKRQSRYQGRPRGRLARRWRRVCRRARAAVPPLEGRLCQPSS